MKTHRIEVRRFKAIAHAAGLVDLQIDADVQAAPAAPDGTASTHLTMTEENARVLQMLLRQQLAELDRRKARSQR